MENYQSYKIQWAGISIEVGYCPDWLDCYRGIYGYPLAHLEIRSANPEPLPITETGYKSHFDRPDNIEAAGGPVALVLAWLDDAAQSPEWQAVVARQRQLTLF